MSPTVTDYRQDRQTVLAVQENNLTTYLPVMLNLIIWPDWHSNCSPTGNSSKHSMHCAKSFHEVTQPFSLAS